jgi:hypothetical protein
MMRVKLRNIWASPSGVIKEGTILFVTEEEGERYIREGIADAVVEPKEPTQEIIQEIKDSFKELETEMLEGGKEENILPKGKGKKRDK